MGWLFKGCVTGWSDDRDVLQEEWWAPPVTGQKPGDFVIMRAEMNCVCVMSACPSDDICGINGPEGTQDVHFEVLEEAKVLST